MIRYRNEVFEDYFIDPITAVITDKNGVKQVIENCESRPTFKGMLVHRIQVHTYLGYLKGKHIHHIDLDKSNNSLDNLTYLTNSEHSHLHNSIKHPFEGKHHSDETKLKMSKAHEGNKCALGYHHSIEDKMKISNSLKGHTSWNKGKKLTEEHKQKIREANSGVKFTEEHKNKIGAANKERMKGFHWWTNFKDSVISDVCPGEGWVRGRTLNK